MAAPSTSCASRTRTRSREIGRVARDQGKAGAELAALDRIKDNLGHPRAAADRLDALRRQGQSSPKQPGHEVTAADASRARRAGVAPGVGPVSPPGTNLNNRRFSAFARSGLRCCVCPGGPTRTGTGRGDRDPGGATGASSRGVAGGVGADDGCAVA